MNPRRVWVIECDGEPHIYPPHLDAFDKESEAYRALTNRCLAALTNRCLAGHPYFRVTKYIPEECADLDSQLAALKNERYALRERVAELEQSCRVQSASIATMAKKIDDVVAECDKPGVVSMGVRLLRARLTGGRI